MNRDIAKGMESFHENKGQLINPYEAGTNQHNDFERGWIQALKRSSVELLKRYRIELEQLK